MLSRLTAPVSNLLCGRSASPAPASVPAAKKGVTELLAELAEVRARKAELERQERELLAAARAEMLREQQALEELRKKVTDYGVDLSESLGQPPAPAVSVPESPAPAEQPAVVSN